VRSAAEDSHFARYVLGSTDIAVRSAAIRPEKRVRIRPEPSMPTVKRGKRAGGKGRSAFVSGTQSRSTKKP